MVLFSLRNIVFKFAKTLRFKTLFLIFAALFLIDFAIPDPLPFVDELLFGLGALLIASWKNKQDADAVQHSAADTKAKTGITIDGEYERKS